MKTWEKTTFPKNVNTGNVSFKVTEALTIVAGDLLELYWPKKSKHKGKLRDKMVIRQEMIDAMTYEQDPDTKEYYYLMPYN